MGLYEKIESDMKAALKGKDTVRLSTLRMLLAAVKNLEVEKRVKRLEDADIPQLIQKDIKRHRESIEQFEKGARQDLADKETLELKILEAYLPKQLSDEELQDIIKAAISECGATTKADAGKVMKAVMEKVKGRADGKLVNRLVMSLLM